MEEHSASELLRQFENYENVQRNIEKAFDCLGDKEARKFLIMFAWDEHHQVFLPFTSSLLKKTMLILYTTSLNYSSKLHSRWTPVDLNFAALTKTINY